MMNYQTPGIYKELIISEPSSLRSGVPAFLGYAAQGAVNQPIWLTHQVQIEEKLGQPLPGSYLTHAVNGFFENGGELCCVVRLEDTSKLGDNLRRGLLALEPLDSIDLICAPDIMKPIGQNAIEKLDVGQVHSLQQLVLDHCDQTGDRFAILDALGEATPTPANNSITSVLAQRQTLKGMNGALYFPWIDIAQQTANTEKSKVIRMPPCGHVAGVYAHSDARNGVHKAPANERLEGVIDVAIDLNDAEQGPLNAVSIDCLRAFPGRGIRVWRAARTLSDDPNWRYINVRRLLLTATRWIERTLAAVVFEPNDARLWAQIRRELTVYFTDLWRRGALLGRSAEEAFYVKCDADTNPAALREAGMVITEIGLASAAPNEFVVVRIVQSASGVTLAGPTLT